MLFASRRFSSCPLWARGGLGERSGLRSGRFDAECLLGYSVGHRRAHERCVSLWAASPRAWGGHGVALAGGAAFDRAALMRNACWAIAWATGALTSDAFRFVPLLFAPGVGAGWPIQGVSFGILPTRYEAESARIRKRSILESVAFQFPAQASAPGPENTKLIV